LRAVGLAAADLLGVIAESSQNPTLRI
jgi:hypothetical protein